MERYLSRNGTPTRKSTQEQRESFSKMAPDTPRLKKNSKSLQCTQTLQGEQEGGEDSLSDLKIPYKSLAAEVAKLLAPEITQSLQKTVSTSLQEIQAAMTQHAGRIDAAENRISSHEDELLKIQAELEQTSKLSQQLMDKVDDLENRSRRNNLRIIGLPEAITPSQLMGICTEELPGCLGINSRLKVERAHRVGPPRTPQQGSAHIRPRPVIVKYLDYVDKSNILQNYRKQTSPVLIRGHKILIFSDYSVEVTKKRRAFSDICTELVNKRIRFALQFPAVLKIFSPSGGTETFVAPDQAREFIRKTLCRGNENAGKEACAEGSG